MKLIVSQEAPSAVGPYSHAVASKDLLFVSGQLGVNPADGKLEPTLEKQTSQALANLKAILKTAGLDKNHVVKTTIFLADINDFKTVNEIYGAFFSPHKPARSTIEVSGLPLGGLIEIEAIAVQ